MLYCLHNVESNQPQLHEHATVFEKHLNAFLYVYFCFTIIQASFKSLEKPNLIKFKYPIGFMFFFFVVVPFFGNVFSLLHKQEELYTLPWKELSKLQMD